MIKAVQCVFDVVRCDQSDGGARRHASRHARPILKIGKIAGSLDFRRLSLEPTSFAYNFSDVGVELAKRWRFPDNFATVITFFSDP